MYLVTYQYAEPNDNLSGPGYSWTQKAQTYGRREDLERLLIGLQTDQWNGCSHRKSIRNVRIYTTTPSEEQDEILAIVEAALDDLDAKKAERDKAKAVKREAEQRELLRKLAEQYPDELEA